MKRLSTILSILIIVVILGACNSDNPEPAQHTDINRTALDKPVNPTNEGPLPEATVKLIDPAHKGSGEIAEVGDPPELTPEALYADLFPGESVSEEKNLFLPPNVTPPIGDILFCFDLTGSMGGELNNVKNNSLNIMNGVRSIIPDSWFGVISHMDYPSTYTTCGYSSQYGSEAAGDYPYSMDQGLSTNIVDVSNAINALNLGSGWDFAEDYTRALYESYSDPAIGFRGGAQKVVVAFLDAVPHDCNFDAILGGVSTTGVDPGRDAIAETGDDLAILDVLDGMEAAGIKLITIFSGSPSDFPLWKEYSMRTGGDAFQINSDGTIPGDIDIAEFITALIGSTITEFEEVTLNVCDPEFEGWLTSVSPVAYMDVVLGEPQDLPFEIMLTVPEDTEAGEYCFEVCALGDGVELDKQYVCINVRERLTLTEVSIDIKPTSCPNPINFKKKGVIPVAILGTGDFDVTQIDPSTIMLEGVAITRSSVEDVATPYTRTSDNCYDCTTLGADGYDDLTLKFDAESIISAIGDDVSDRDCIVLTLTGNLKEEFGGGEITGTDIIRVQK